jgi:hypothetical protein
MWDLEDVEDTLYLEYSGILLTWSPHGLVSVSLFFVDHICNAQWAAFLYGTKQIKGGKLVTDYKNRVLPAPDPVD